MALLTNWLQTPPGLPLSGEEVGSPPDKGELEGVCCSNLRCSFALTRWLCGSVPFAKWGARGACRRWSGLLCGALLLFASASARAAPTEYELKAAFIYQIARFVEWPSSPAPQTTAPLRLCVLGGNPFGPALHTISGKPAGGRKMEVALLEMNADTRECAMLFIAAPAERHLERIAALSRGSGMLTIGDTEGFARRGVMVNFLLEDGKVRFEINPEASRRAGLRISSQLLKLARVVKEEAP